MKKSILIALFTVFLVSCGNKNTESKQAAEIDTKEQAVSSILGHASSQSTMNYLRVDLEGMKKCLLEVPQVPDSFYTQKGGIFYE